MSNIIDTANGVYLQIILSAFFGGLFAGLFSNYFESKRRISDKRRDKYYENRNAIVQIEHELSPIRVNLSRDVTSLKDSLDNTNESNKRIVLRFYKLNLSPGLSLSLLNLDLINLYASVFGKFETINNDIDYIDQIVKSIIENKKFDRIDENLVNQYFTFSDYLLDEIVQADKESLRLLSFCKCIIDKNEKKIIDKYLKSGGQVEYNFREKSINTKIKQIFKEENKPYQKNEIRPKFITPFLDIKRVAI